MKFLVMTKSKSMNKFLLDVQAVNPSKEELEKRVEEIIKKLILNGDKKEIIAYSDFELWKFGEISEDYEEFKKEKEKLIDYGEMINKVKNKLKELL